MIPESFDEVVLGICVLIGSFAFVGGLLWLIQLVLGGGALCG